jgi:hypothetical protein
MLMCILIAPGKSLQACVLLVPCYNCVQLYMVVQDVLHMHRSQQEVAAPAAGSSAAARGGFAAQPAAASSKTSTGQHYCILQRDAAYGNSISDNATNQGQQGHDRTFVRCCL